MTKTNGRSGDRWIDPDTDPVSVYETYEADLVAPEDEDTETGADPATESVLVEFVDRFNARDIDGIEELLTPDAAADLLSARGRGDLVEGLLELWERYPGLLLTRGEVGPEPVAAAWIPDTERSDFDLLGVLRFEWGDDDLIGRFELVESPADAVLERPDPSELNEWEDWRIIDEG